MWVFIRTNQTGKFRVGYYIPVFSPEIDGVRGSDEPYMEFFSPFDGYMDMDVAMRTVHYLNGGAAGAVGDLQDSFADRFPKL